MIGLDQRPINLARLSTETLSSGLSATLPLGSGGEPLRRGSMLVGISHVWRLGDSVSIRDTLPRLDLLAVDGGGVPRHRLDGGTRDGASTPS